jgi:hypothetical protein
VKRESNGDQHIDRQSESPKLDSADFIICQMSLSLRFRPPNRENVVSHKAISCTIIFVFLFQCQAINHRR